MYGYFSSLLLPGIMHKLSCGDVEDGGTKHASVLHPWSQVSWTGERNCKHQIMFTQGRSTMTSETLALYPFFLIVRKSQGASLQKPVAQLMYTCASKSRKSQPTVSRLSHHLIFDCLQLFVKMEEECPFYHEWCQRLFGTFMSVLSPRLLSHVEIAMAAEMKIFTNCVYEFLFSLWTFFLSFLCAIIKFHELFSLS